MDNSLSNKIRWINFICTLQIVLRHATRFLSYPTRLSTYCSQLTVVSMYFFFFTSGLLFFNNFKFNKFREKIKKRCRTVLLPYFLWNFIGWISLLLRQIVTGDIITVLNVKEFCGGFELALSSGIIVFDGPIWYMLRLFSYLIVVPLIYPFLKNKISGYSAILLSIILNIIYAPDYFSFLNWLPIFLIGSFVGLHYIKDFQSKQYDDKYFLTSLSVLLAVIITCIGIYNIDFGGSAYRGRTICNLYLIWIIIFIFLMLKQIQLPTFPQKIAPYTFFIYSTHYLILDWISTLFRLYDIESFKYLWLICGVFTIIISGMMGVLIKKYMPKVYSVLTGGRI